jgi:hypothetical protein
MAAFRVRGVTFPKPLCNALRIKELEAKTSEVRCQISDVRNNSGSQYGLPVVVSDI